MRSRPVAALLLLSNLCVAMAQAPATVSLRRSELGKHPFEIGQLRLTLVKLGKGTILLGSVQIKVENRSDSGIDFNPEFLSLVGKDSVQVNTLTYRSRTPPSLKVLPGAVVKEYYWLDHKVKLPASLYYDGKELALIME
jgi:hypothetical protein